MENEKIVKQYKLGFWGSVSLLVAAVGLTNIVENFLDYKYYQKERENTEKARENLVKERREFEKAKDELNRKIVEARTIISEAEEVKKKKKWFN